MRKRALVLAALALSSMMSISAYAGEWKQDNTGWWYQNDDGSYPTNTWQEIDGKQYYFGNDGYMFHDTTTPDGYQVGSDGAWIQAEEKSLEQQVKENEQLQASLTDDQKRTIWERVKSQAKLQLKYSHTAKFPEWNDEGIDYFVYHDDKDGSEKIMVTAWCEAKNGFGNYCEAAIDACAYRSGQIVFVLVSKR